MLAQRETGLLTLWILFCGSVILTELLGDVHLPMVVPIGELLIRFLLFKDIIYGIDIELIAPI